jgi:hypothetical protein
LYVFFCSLCPRGPVFLSPQKLRHKTVFEIMYFKDWRPGNTPCSVRSVNGSEDSGRQGYRHAEGKVATEMHGIGKHSRD